MPASCSVMILVSRSRRWRSRASRSGGLAEPPAELCDKVRAAADRLLAGTPLRSDGKLTILSLAQEAGIKRWLLTHKYPHPLKDKYQAEFRAAGHKSQPVQTAEQETARLRTELGKARAEQRRLTELNQTYAAIINQLADDLAQATAERDTLTAAGSVTRITTRHQVPPSG